MSTEKILRVTIQFDPSPSLMPPLFDQMAPGEAKYGIRYAVDNVEQPALHLPPCQTCFTFEEKENARIIGLISACGANGIWSPAVQFDFRVRDKRPPEPVSRIRVSNVHLVLPVITESAASPVESKQVAAIPTPPSMGYKVSVNGHPLLKDGAVGELLDIDTRAPQNSVIAGFTASAFHAETNKSSEISLVANDTYIVSVITPEQDVIPLSQFLSEQLKLRNANSEAATAADTIR